MDKKFHKPKISILCYFFVQNAYFLSPQKYYYIDSEDNSLKQSKDCIECVSTCRVRKINIQHLAKWLMIDLA